MFETTQYGVDVGIMTRNIEAMKAFYRDVLGLEEVDVRDIPADFLKKLGVAKGGARLHVLRFGEMRFKLMEIDPAPPVGDTSVDTQSGFRYLTFWVKDMEAAVDHLRASGVPLLSKVQSRFPGRKVVFIKDPDGNLLELNSGNAPSEVRL